MDWQDVDHRIAQIEAALPRFGGKPPHFKSLWADIKETGAGFKGVRYPTREQREQAWQRFQAAVAKIKEFQQAHFAQMDNRARDSARYKEAILAKAEAATPSAFGDLAYVIVPPLALIKMAVDTLLPGPPVDDEKEQLMRCSEQLKEGWRLLGQFKNEMNGTDKQESFNRLKEAETRLQEAWDRWKGARAEARGTRQRAAEARREERDSKRADFERRVRANLTKNEERLEKMNAALARSESHLDELREKAESARSDGFRARVEGWIEEEEARIQDIKASIERVEGWIAEDREKLSAF